MRSVLSISSDTWQEEEIHLTCFVSKSNLSNQLVKDLMCVVLSKTKTKTTVTIKRDFALNTNVTFHKYPIHFSNQFLSI